MNLLQNLWFRNVTEWTPHELIHDRELIREVSVLFEVGFLLEASWGWGLQKVGRWIIFLP